MFEKCQFVNKFKLSGIISSNLYMLMNIFTGLEKTKTPEYIKECYALLLPILDISQNIVMVCSAEDLPVAFKLFQKVLYLIRPGDIPSEKIAGAYKKLLEIEKKINSIQDENLSLVYVETLGKFLLAHIEKLEPAHKKEVLLGYYHKSFELYIGTQTKKQKALVFVKNNFLNFQSETLVESLVNTTRILIELKVICKLEIIVII